MMQHKYVSKRAVLGATLLVVSLGFSLSTQAFPFFKKKKKPDETSSLCRLQGSNL